MAAPARRPIPFTSFGGLRLDQAIDEVGGNNAIFARDVDWDGSPGRIRPRFGFQKLKAAEASGTVKALFPHSALRMLITKRISSESLKLVAIDKEFTEKVEATLNKNVAKSTFAHYGTPSASYTYMRTNTTEQKVVRFDGTAFTEPTISIWEGSVEKSKEKVFPKGAFMATWPDAGNVLIVANTGSTGGPNGAASSASHVWISRPASAEQWEETSFIQLSPGDGEEITALTVFGGQVFVFKETKLFVIYSVNADEEGLPVYRFREVSLGEGSRMKRASSELLAETSDQLATAAPTGCYFCTSDGVYVTTGGQPTKISDNLKPLEEVTPFDGPMAEFLNGSTESFRWPASGIYSLGSSILVKRYEFIFKLDLPTGDWTCWKAPAVSLAVWTGLTGGGAEAATKRASNAANAASGLAEPLAWENPTHMTEKEGWAEKGGFAAITNAGSVRNSEFLKPSEFGFAIPAGSTIVGISLTIQRFPDASGVGFAVSDSVVKLCKAGVAVGENKQKGIWPEGIEDEITGPEKQTRIYGSATDLWGTSWSVAEVNASNFGFVIAITAAQVQARIYGSGTKITVSYVTPEASSGVRPRLFASQSKFIYFQIPEAEEQMATRDAQWQSGFYDLEDPDEKSLVETKMWGKGTVTMASYKDFKEEAGFEDAIAMGEDTDVGWSHSEHTGTLFSHRLKLAAGSAVQRLSRYILEKRDPTTGTDTR